MTLHKYFLITSVLLASLPSFGQKIKYKELFVLLNAKQYDQAEPFLKKFLVDNMDHPNALLFMAYIQEEKALAADVLTGLDKINANTDSSVLFFDLAFKSIDDKELRKNDEYYQMHSRRDMRTGKFGIKLSDVQFDIEKRSKYLKDRQQRILVLHQLFNKTKGIYHRCEVAFKNITDRYKDQREFFLRSDDALKLDLRNLARKYDSLLVTFNDYTTQLATLGKTGYNQELDVQQIDAFKHDGFVDVDFLQDEIKVWDYKRWALVNLDLIENEIEPSINSLVKIDADLNALREKIRKDSVSVVQEAKTILDNANKLSLKKYDPDPMPLAVFNLKFQELNYGSYLAQTKELRDSSDLRLKQTLFKRDVKLLNSLDSVGNILKKRDLNTDVLNYKTFITNAFGTADVLKSLITTTHDFAVSEKISKEATIKSIDDKLNWIIDAGDSIPASSEVKSKLYLPLSIVAEKYTYGVKLEDTVKAYFYSITPSRAIGLKGVHPLDTMFRREYSDVIRGVTTSSAANEHFVLLYSFKKFDGKVPAYVYMVGPDGKNWNSKFMLDGIPEEISFNEESRGVAIKVTNETGSKTISIDKSGKLVP